MAKVKNQPATASISAARKKIQRHHWMPGPLLPADGNAGVLAAGSTPDSGGLPLFESSITVTRGVAVAPDAAAVAVGVELAGGVGTGLGERVGVAVAEPVGVSLPSGVSVAVAVGVSVAPGTGVSVRVGVAVTVDVFVDVPVTVGVVVGTDWPTINVAFDEDDGALLTAALSVSCADVH